MEKERAEPDRYFSADSGQWWSAARYTGGQPTDRMMVIGQLPSRQWSDRQFPMQLVIRQAVSCQIDSSQLVDRQAVSYQIDSSQL